MKAALRKTYGKPEVISIEDVKKPKPKANEVLIKVKATTVNRTDCANLTAKPFIMRFVLGLRKPKLPILGTDFAGEIMAMGKDVKDFELGERVMGFNDSGLESQSEFTAVNTEHVWKIPSDVSFESAAAALEGAHYAYSFLKRSPLKKGQRVLINGATGAIGSALLQFSRMHDVHISATCKTEMHETIKALGADRVIDYTQEDFTQDNRQYDFIFDSVGKTTFKKCQSVLTKKGVYISSELGPYAQNVFFAVTTGNSKSQRVVFPIPFSTKESVPFILDVLEKKQFNPLIDLKYTLADIAEAYTYALSGEKNGNLIINIE
jgi:NADPH:quinone reductase-like Zn-dependent oxidoreductase